MYTLEQLEILKERLNELNRLKSRLEAINASDMRFSIQIDVKSKNYSFNTESHNKAMIDILKNSYELQISRLENKINSTTILELDTNAF